MQNELQKKHCEQAARIGLYAALLFFVGIFCYLLSDLDNAFTDSRTGDSLLWAGMSLSEKFFGIIFMASWSLIIAAVVWLVVSIWVLIIKEVHDPTISGLSLKAFREASKRERDKLKIHNS